MSTAGGPTSDSSLSLVSCVATDLFSMFVRTSPMISAAVLLLVYAVYKCFRDRQAWAFLLKGRQMIQAKYESADQRPFSLPIFGYRGRFHVVSSEQHWKELKNADRGHLSMHEWSKGVFRAYNNAKNHQRLTNRAQFFQPKYTLLEAWPAKRDELGMPFIRAIRTITNHMPEMKPHIIELYTEGIDKAIEGASVTGGGSGLCFRSHCSRITCLKILVRFPYDQW